MNSVASEYKEKYKLNYSVLATPAEGLSGHFTRIDRKVYGIIPRSERPRLLCKLLSYRCKARFILEKIKKEAPFHALTGGGHITYVELDGEAKKNIPAILKIVKVMYDQHIGYGSINHPVDTCKQCGYKGVIYDKCPVAAANIFFACGE